MFPVVANGQLLTNFTASLLTIRHEQKVLTLMRCSKMLHLIRVCSICNHKSCIQPWVKIRQLFEFKVVNIFLLISLNVFWVLKICFPSVMG